MEKNELKQMRTRQLLAVNGLLLVFITLYFLLIYNIPITFSHLFWVLGAVILTQSILGLAKLHSTKSLVPVFEKVAEYEKQKMGAEWKKQRRMGYIWNLIVGGFMFLQSYWYQDSTIVNFQPDIGFMLVFALFVAGLINVSLILHIKKVDHSHSQQDLQGYTWKSNVIAVIAGIALAVIFFIFTISYIFSTI